MLPEAGRLNPESNAIRVLSARVHAMCPSGSSRRAHLEEEVVAAREQQPAGPSQHVDPAGVHMPIVQHMHVHAASQSR